MYAVKETSEGSHPSAERAFKNGHGVIRIANKTEKLVSDPPNGMPSKDVLKHVVLHELLHECLNRARWGEFGDCPQSDPRIEMQTDEEGKAAHRFVIDLLDCLIPSTEGLSVLPSPPLPPG